MRESVGLYLAMLFVPPRTCGTAEPTIVPTHNNSGRVGGAAPVLKGLFQGFVTVNLTAPRHWQAIAGDAAESPGTEARVPPVSVHF